MWPRSASVLAVYATIQTCGIPIYLITGGREIHTEEPTIAEWVVLAVLVAALPLSVLAGWLVSLLPHKRIRTITATIVVAVAVTAGVFEAGPGQLREAALVIAVVLILTGCGVGSVMGWAARMTLSHLATVGALVVRALPVVLLTALVFFNTYVWLMAATIGDDRLWAAMAFLVGIAGVFVISATVERVRPMLRSAATPPHDCEMLADTPFAAMTDPPVSPRLTRYERLNVVFVVAISQLVQIMVVAVVTAAIYLILGLILLSPALLKEWTHTDKNIGTVLGMTVPVPGSLIHMCLFLGALTFMYISARAAGDAEYRSTFLDPLIGDLHATLIARNRYRGSVATVDADEASD